MAGSHEGLLVVHTSFSRSMSLTLVIEWPPVIHVASLTTEQSKQTQPSRQSAHKVLYYAAAAGA